MHDDGDDDGGYLRVKRRTTRVRRIVKLYKDSQF